MWRNAFVWNPWIFFDKSFYGMGLDKPDVWIMAFGLLVVLGVSTLQQRGSVGEMLSRQNLAFRWAIVLVLIGAVLVFGWYGEGYNPAGFIYGNF